MPHRSQARSFPRRGEQSLGEERVTEEILGRQCNVSERVTIERGLERQQSVAQHAGKLAATRDRALVAGGKVFDQGEVRLGQPDHVT